MQKYNLSVQVGDEEELEDSTMPHLIPHTSEDSPLSMTMAMPLGNLDGFNLDIRNTTRQPPLKSSLSSSLSSPRCNIIEKIDINLVSKGEKIKSQKKRGIDIYSKQFIQDFDSLAIIYDTLESIFSNNQLKYFDIPSPVTAIISCYALGAIINCDDKQCNQEIFILPSYILKGAKFYETILDMKSNSYHHYCMSHLFICMRCNQNIHQNNSNECVLCCESMCAKCLDVRTTQRTNIPTEDVWVDADDTVCQNCKTQLVFP